MNILSHAGFLRLKQIIGCKKTGIPAIIPVSPSTWWKGVKEGIYPQSVKLTTRTTACVKAMFYKGLLDYNGH